MRLSALFALSLAPLAAACTPAPVAGDPAALMPPGRTWTIAAAGGMARPAEATATLTRTAGGIAGDSGCNRYFGAARFEPDRLDFTEIGSTRMACPAPLMAFEQRVLRALEDADSVSGAPGGELTLTAEGRAVMRLSPLNP